MAMPVDERFAREFGKGKGVIVCALLEKLAEQEDLLRQGLGAFVLREKVRQFVSEDGSATGFEDDDGRGGFDFGEKLVHDPEQQALGAIKHANVVKRAAAAEVGTRDADVETRGFEDFNGGFGGRGEEIVVERVGPEEDGSAGVSPA